MENKETITPFLILLSAKGPDQLREISNEIQALEGVSGTDPRVSKRLTRTIRHLADLIEQGA